MKAAQQFFLSPDRASARSGAKKRHRCSQVVIADRDQQLRKPSRAALGTEPFCHQIRCVPRGPGNDKRSSTSTVVQDGSAHRRGTLASSFESSAAAEQLFCTGASSPSHTSGVASPSHGQTPNVFRPHHTPLELQIEIHRNENDGSLGLELEICAGQPTICSIVPGGAAERNGLTAAVKAGDIVLSIDAPGLRRLSGAALIEAMATNRASTLRLHLRRDPAHTHCYTTMALADSWLDYYGEGGDWARGFFLLTVGAGLQACQSASPAAPTSRPQTATFKPLRRL